MEETTGTQHPDPAKKGVRISAARYRDVREELTFAELTAEARRRLGPGFPRSVPWYVITVKLDLEARGELNCDRSAGPQRIRRREGCRP